MPSYLNNVDLNKNQLVNSKLHMLPTGSIPTPNAGNEALIGYDTTIDLPWWIPASGSPEYLYPLRSSNTASTAVLRDSSGNFSAGTITASLTGNASTATTLQTQRAFSITGKATAAGVNFNGSAAVALSVTALSVAASDIALTSGQFLVGNGSNVAAATAKSSIPLSGFGAAAANVSMGGNRITNLADPVNPQDAATMAFAEALIQGLNTKRSVKVKTTGNINLSSPGTTIDGVTMVSGDRFLAGDQTTGSQNGIYVWNGSTATATRALDADSAAELRAAYVWVEEGATYGDTGWVQTADSITLGSTTLTWAQFSGAGTVTAGNGISKVGNTLHFFGAAYTPNSIYASSSTSALSEITAVASTVLMRGASGGITFGATLPAAVQGNITQTGTVTSGTWASTIDLATLNTSSAGVLTLAANTGAISKTVGTANQVLRMSSGSVLGFGAINLGSSSAVSGILTASNGGTSNGFFAVSGPASATKTFTFPNRNATIPEIKRFSSVVTAAGATGTYAHGLGRWDIMVQLFVTATGEQVYADIDTDNTNIYVTMTPAVAAGEYTIIAVG